MNYYNERTQSYAVSGINAYMRQVYLWMTAALGVSAAAALFTATNPAILQAMYTSPFLIVLFAVGLIGLSVYITARIHTLSSGSATGLFMIYAAGMGVFLGPTLTLYTGSSVVNAFLVTAGTFGGMSLYGMTTKRDLTGMGSFMMMGLWGLLLAMIVNMFIGSGPLDMAISVIGVIVFTGLTAYDTQKLMHMGLAAPEDDALAMRRGAILGALTLYLDFINMFLMMLRLFGNRE